MNARTIYLRIKIKSLVAEAQIIRQEAKKTSGNVKWGLNDHRKMVVRHHIRHNLLAYCIIKGTPYSAIEKKCEILPDFKKIVVIARKFGATDEVINLWLEEAEAYAYKEIVYLTRTKATSKNN